MNIAARVHDLVQRTVGAVIHTVQPLFRGSDDVHQSRQCLHIIVHEKLDTYRAEVCRWQLTRVDAFDIVLSTSPRRACNCFVHAACSCLRSSACTLAKSSTALDLQDGAWISSCCTLVHIHSRTLGPVEQRTAEANHCAAFSNPLRECAWSLATVASRGATRFECLVPAAVALGLGLSQTPPTMSVAECLESIRRKNAIKTKWLQLTRSSVTLIHLRVAVMCAPAAVRIRCEEASRPTAQEHKV